MSEQVGVTLLDSDGRLDPVIEAASAVGVPIEGRYGSLVDIRNCPDCLVVPDGPAAADRPETNGLALLEAARDRLDCPVVVYTSREGYEAIRSPLDAGAADVIRVPEYRPHLIGRRVAYAAGYGGSFQSSGEQIASLLRNYPHTLFLKDDVGRFENVTAHTANNYGFTRQQLIGMSDYELFSTEHADELWEAEQEVVQRGEPRINSVEEYVDQNGERRWVSTTKVPRRTADGRIIGIVGGTQDVTPAKQQESLMEALHEASRRLTRATSRPEIAAITTEIAAEIENLPAVQVALATPDGELEPVDVTKHNQGACEDDRTAEEQPGRNIFERYETAFRRAYESGTTQYVDTDGQLTAAADVVNPVFEGEFESDEVGIAIPLSGHGVLGVTAPSGIVDEFTDRLAHVLSSNVAAAFDRAERERELAQKNRRLGEFATLGAHELRNRLQVAFAHIARERSDRGSEPLGRAEDTLERMDRLLTQLLQLAKTGTIPSATDRVDLRDAARQAWEEIDTPPEATLSPPSETSVVANREALLEIFGTLFENSVEHGLPDGSETAAGTLTVDVRVTESAFYVADNGIGIPDERRKRLFDLEYADSDAGYGLYIVSTLVEAHGWDISVTDSDSDGTRFEISGVETPGTDCS